MMNKICPRCKTVYKYNQDGCPNGCAKKLRAESNKTYDKDQRANNKFYDSKEWKKLRELCKNKFINICIWSYYKHNKLVRGRVAHHIIPITVNKELSLKLSNLLFVSDEAHAEIHKLYIEATGKDFIEANKSILEDIYKYIKRWDKEGGTLESF